MSHDVFISHSSEDRSKAVAVCSALESRRIQCWISSRDILPGADWGEAIINAIAESRLMILVLSRNANKSKQIKKEVERAVDKGVVVVPLRIEDVTPAGSLEYFLGTQQRIDAFALPFERHLDQISQSIKAALDKLEIHAKQEQIVEAVAPKQKAGSIPIQVYSLEEVEELSKNEDILLITFYAEPGFGENNARKKLKQNIFPAIFRFLWPNMDSIAIRYARARGPFLRTPIGKQLDKLGFEVLGAFLFRDGKIVIYSNVSSDSVGSRRDDEYIAAAQSVLFDFKKQT
jgi:hypothetical protein